MADNVLKPTVPEEVKLRAQFDRDGYAVLPELLRFYVDRLHGVPENLLDGKEHTNDEFKWSNCTRCGVLFHNWVNT